MRRFLAVMLVPTLFAVVLCAPATGYAAEEKHGPAEKQTAGAGGHGETHAEGVPLDFKKDLAIWSLVTFVLFAIVLRTFAWGPLSAGLNTREQRIREDIAAAEKNRLQTEKLLAEHARKLEKVQEEVREIVAEARRDAEHTKQDIVSEAQREAEATKQRAIAEINRARDGALKDLFDVMGKQVASATEHVLGRSLTPGDQDRLINEALAEISSSN